MRPLLFLFLFLPFAAFAQTQGTVRGAESQEPLPGANVFVLETPEKGTITDALGRFSLPPLPDSCHLVVSFIGYEEQLVPVRKTPLTVELVPKSQVLEEVTIAGKTLVAEEFRVEKLSQLDVYTNPISKADPVLAVNALPSSTTTDESANLSLRGSSPAETGLFLNGVPLYDVTRFSQINGVGTLSIFNTSIIQKVEVFPGNPPLEFGNTSSGLVALETTDALPEENQYGISLNLANVGIQTQQRIGDKVGLTVFGNFSPDFALKGLNPEAFAQIEDFQSLDLGVQAVARFPKATLKVFNYTLAERYEFHDQHPSGALVYRQKRRRNFSVLSYRYRSGGWEWESNAGLSLDRFRFSGGNTALDNRQLDSYLATSLTYRQPDWSLKGGLSWDRRRSDAEGRAPQFSYALTEAYPSFSYAGREIASVPEGYLYAKYHLSDKLTLGGGLRKSLPVGNTPDYWSGQLNLAQTLGKHHKIILAAGQYHRLVLPRGEGTIPLLFRSRQLSLDYRFETKKWTFHNALFRKFNQNPQFEEDIFGLESFVAFRLPQKLDATLSLTVLDAERQREDQPPYPSPFDLNYFVRGSLSYKPNAFWTLGAAWLWRSGTYFRPLTDIRFDTNLELYAPEFAPRHAQERLPFYQTLNLNASRLFPLGEEMLLIAFAGLTNALDRQNVAAYSYNPDYSERRPQLFSRRTFFVGLELRF